MSASAARFPGACIRCPWRPIILFAAGMAASCVALVHAVVHVVPTVVRREYNSGLGTALVLFLPRMEMVWQAAP
jgi:hypothetical protein